MGTIELKDVMKAVLARYGGWLYNAALVKFIYLLDIESVRHFGVQVTAIRWVRDNFGPFVWDVLDCARNHPGSFEIQDEGEKRRIVCTDPERNIQADVENLIDFLARTIPNPKNNFRIFLEYVYATPPMLLSRSNGLLDIATAVRAEKDVDAVMAMLDTPEWDEALAYLAAN